MKYKTTMKAVMAGYQFVISVGYCDLQNLLRFQNPIAYTCGTYGWNADIYDFGNVAICTGYRPFGNVSSSTIGLNHLYDAMAMRIIAFTNKDDSYEAKKEKVNKILETYIKTVLSTYSNKKKRKGC